jgi:hypothetical protein
MTRTWYLVALVPLVLCGAIAAVAFSRLVAGIEEMPRMVAPGEKTFTLPPGQYVVYAESQSTVDGTAYVNKSFHVQCAMTAADGKQLELSSHGSKLTYAVGGYEGRAIFDVTLPSDGPTRLACQTDGNKAVLAIGRSFAAMIVVGVVPLVLGIIAAVVAFVIVYRKRKRYLATGSNVRAA